MVNEKVMDFETTAREAILDYVFASSEEWQRLRDQLETIYEICRFQPAYKNNPAYRGIRAEMEYTLGITRRKRRTETLARLKNTVLYHRAGYTFCCVAIALLKASVPFVVLFVRIVAGRDVLQNFTDCLDSVEAYFQGDSI
jgi:hypothetical protein